MGKTYTDTPKADLYLLWMLILQQTFPNMQQIGRNQLVFCEGDYTAFDILRFIADRHIALLKLERAEPTLESLFMEVVEK